MNYEVRLEGTAYVPGWIMQSMDDDGNEIDKFVELGFGGFDTPHEAEAYIEGYRQGLEDNR